MTTTTTPTDAPPDWSTGEADLACPLCDYNLRGLTDPRCPECGFAFRWAELLDQGRDGHRWLFEHGRGRNLRTFLSTWTRTTLPEQFWQAVTPAHTIRLGRLLLYWLAGCLPLLALVATPLVHDAILMDRDLRSFRAVYQPVPGHPGLYAAPGRKTMLTAQQIDHWMPRLFSVGFVRRVFIFHTWRADLAWTGPTAVVVAWPLLSAVALLLFQASLRRAKIRPAHVLRVALYGCDFALLLTAATFVAARFGHPLPNPFRVSPMSDKTAEAILFAIVTCAAIATWRTSVACRRYLRVDHPLLTAMAAQSIVLLFACVALVKAAKVLP